MPVLIIVHLNLNSRTTWESLADDARYDHTNHRVFVRYTCLVVIITPVLGFYNLYKMFDFVSNVCMSFVLLLGLVFKFYWGFVRLIQIARVRIFGFILLGIFWRLIYEIGLLITSHHIDEAPGEDKIYVFQNSFVALLDLLNVVSRDVVVSMFDDGVRYFQQCVRVWMQLVLSDL